MPEYRFNYSGDMSTSLTHDITAKDDADAFKQKEGYLTSILGEYKIGSMKVFRHNKWIAVSEASPELQADLVAIFQDIAKVRRSEPGRRLENAELMSGNY